MDAKTIKKKYTRVVKMTSGFNCYLQIDHQSFCLVENRTRTEANWFAKMISVAIARLINSNVGC